mgnify:CR=1 FL=1|jgi:hypothetical protein
MYLITYASYSFHALRGNLVSEISEFSYALKVSFPGIVLYLLREFVFLHYKVKEAVLTYPKKSSYQFSTFLLIFY